MFLPQELSGEKTLFFHLFFRLEKFIILWYNYPRNRKFNPLRRTNREIDISTAFEQGYAYEKQGDFLRAIEYYEIASTEGHDEAECRLATIYRFGRGVPKDYEKALHWYYRSAEKGNSYAQSNIGSMYRFGQVGPEFEKNYDLAFEWYTKAAEQGNDYAEQNIGSMYRFGEGRERNAEEALYPHRKRF